MKPEILEDGRVVEIERVDGGVVVGGGVVGRWTRPHVRSELTDEVGPGDRYSTDIYPNVRALRAALRDGSAELEADADRQQRSKPYKRID